MPVLDGVKRTELARRASGQDVYGMQTVKGEDFRFSHIVAPHID